MPKAGTEEAIAQFCGITGASVKDARRFVTKYKRVDLAIDAYYSDPASRNTQANNANTIAKLNTIFDKYQDPTQKDLIAIDGTIKLCEDLKVNPEDVVMLAVAYELKSTGVGEWKRTGWNEGWLALGCDSLASMQTAVPRLRSKLGSDTNYFRKVYNSTFDFARAENQRSLALDTAQAFWGLLLPHGLEGGALRHVASLDDDDEDEHMAAAEDGWRPEYTEWWFEFLNEKGGKGVSKDTWTMLLDFIRVIDRRFENHDSEAAWPSTIDEFVEWAKEKSNTA